MALSASQRQLIGLGSFLVKTPRVNRGTCRRGEVKTHGLRQGILAVYFYISLFIICLTETPHETSDTDKMGELLQLEPIDLISEQARKNSLLRFPDSTIEDITSKRDAVNILNFALTALLLRQMHLHPRK